MEDENELQELKREIKVTIKNSLRDLETRWNWINEEHLNQLFTKLEEMLQRKEFGNAQLDIKGEAVLQPLGCCMDELKHPSTIKPQCSMEDCLNCLLEETDMLRKTEILEDPVENLRAKLVKQADVKTKDLVGNRTTTSAVIALACIVEGVKVVVADGSPNLITEEAGVLETLEADKHNMGAVAKGAAVLVGVPHSCTFAEHCSMMDGLKGLQYKEDIQVETIVEAGLMVSTTDEVLGKTEGMMPATFKGSVIISWLYSGGQEEQSRNILKEKKWLGQEQVEWEEENDIGPEFSGKEHMGSLLMSAPPIGWSYWRASIKIEYIMLRSSTIHPSGQG